MELKDSIIKMIEVDPIGFRSLLEDPHVSKALDSIGVLPKILELHAPQENARNREGLGLCLCGIRGTRHRIVTCRRCKRILNN